MPKRTTDCKDRIAERYDASFKRGQSVWSFLAINELCSYLIMGKSMEDSTILGVLGFYDEFLIATT